MRKPNHLFSHLLDPSFRDRLSSVQLTGSPNRLRLLFGVIRGDWDTVASYIAGPSRWPVTWCPDANVAFLPTTDVVWDALRVAALGSVHGSTLITGPVEAEMKEWLDDPWLLKKRAGDISAALTNQTWIRKYRLDPTRPVDQAVVGYAHLLGARRSLARPCRDGTTLLGTDAADKVGTMNAIMKNMGPRALGLAKKGRKDAERRGRIYIDDEMHCLMVIANALVNCTDAVLLTADEDYLEIFYKAQWFLDTHYRAWLAARLIKDRRYGEPVKEVADTSGYFRGPVTLYRRPTGQLQEVLPPARRPVRVGLLYVAPDSTIHTMVFPFEQPMLDMLATRGVTDGRCTDLFGDSNIHVDLGPLKRTLDALYLGIGQDTVTEFKTSGFRCRLANLDLEHSVNCWERSAV